MHVKKIKSKIWYLLHQTNAMTIKEIRIFQKAMNLMVMILTQRQKLVQKSYFTHMLKVSLLTKIL